MLTKYSYSHAALKKDEADWAIAFAIPADAKGVYLIGRESHFAERAPGMEAPIAEFGDVESFTVFDHVFVPNERIFINGETDFGGEVALLFALFHRHSYCGCKPGMGDVLMGATALLADYLGIEKMPHVKEKLAEMVSVAELVFAAGIASAVKSRKAPSGTQIPNIIYANVGRRHAGHNIYHDITSSATLPGTSRNLPCQGIQLPGIGASSENYVTPRKSHAENHTVLPILAATF